MIKNILKILILFFFITNNTIAEEILMILKLKHGDVKIELFSDVAPNHVERIKKLANDGKYDGVVFHRVIDGFMAQTGDVKFGNSSSNDYDLRRAGTGESSLPDLPSEFNDIPHIKRNFINGKIIKTLIVQIVSFLYVLIMKQLF